MDALATVGAQLVFFAVSLGLMQFALGRRRTGGLFSALPLGLLPALALSVTQFMALQQPGLPEVQAERAEWTDIVKKLAAQQAPDKDQAGDRAALQDFYLRCLEAEPAGQFCVIMIVLAPLAAYLRRRQARRGAAPDPGPLSRWCAPWGLVWLVLAPGFWWLASHYGLVSAPDWVDHLALNVLMLGMVIFLFQGLVVAGAKMAGWARDPRTRVLAVLCLAFLAVAFLFADRVGLLQPFALLLLLMGLLEPWIDVRHLKAPPQKGGA